MTRQRLRIFVSSPGDVMAAREVTAQVAEKLAHEYARFCTIEPYLWEYEPMLASDISRIRSTPRAVSM